MLSSRSRQYFLIIILLIANFDHFVLIVYVLLVFCTDNLREGVYICCEGLGNKSIVILNCRSTLDFEYF